VFAGPNWSCSRRLSLPPEPSWQNGFKQAAAANLLNVSARHDGASSAAAGGKRGFVSAGFKCLVPLLKWIQFKSQR